MTPYEELESVRKELAEARQTWDGTQDGDIAVLAWITTGAWLVSEVDRLGGRVDLREAVVKDQAATIERLRDYIINTPCWLCTMVNPARRGANCGQCAKAREALAVDEDPIVGYVACWKDHGNGKHCRMPVGHPPIGPDGHMIEA